jgi:hypothetical protein
MTSNQPWWLAWPVEEVAAALLPLFSHPPLSPWSDANFVLDDIVSWCKTGHFTGRTLKESRSGIGFLPTETCFKDPDYRAINEAMQVLEQTRLIVRYVSGGSGPSYMATCEIGLTRSGTHALQTNTVRQHLGLADAPPTA